MSDLDAWLDDYQPYIATAKVCGRADLIDEHSRLDQALQQASSKAGDVMHEPELAAAQKAVWDIEARIEASEREFRFQGIGHQAWQDLKKKFPPTAEQRKDGLDTNMERFAPEAIAASSLNEMTAPQAQRMMTLLPPGEFEKLFKATLEANGQVIGPPKSVLAAVIERLSPNGGSSTTAAREASPDLSSLDVLDDLSPDTGTTTTDD